MQRRRLGSRALVAAGVALCALPMPASGHEGHDGVPEAVAIAAGVEPAPFERAAADDPRYALVHGCYAVRSQRTGRFLARDGDGWSAGAADVAGAEAFRMQATTLGRYLLYSRSRDFLAAGTDGRAVVAAEPSPAADLEVRESGPHTLTAASGPSLTVDDNGAVRTAEQPDGDGARFTFVRAEGCPAYPEVEVNADGVPSRGPTPYSGVRGTTDAHMHMMAFEFLGGRAHCGRPWHPYGAPYALVDCPDHHTAEGNAAVLENVLSKDVPVGGHDPVGWPTFKDWPAPGSLTHEQSYYKWLERAWRAGQRVFVNLFVDNEVLCNVYPYKKNPCDDMAAVRLQHQRLHELQDYIDAQSGGPGKGWFRIVTDPFQARRVINDGKLAVVMGIEVSRLFGCGIRNDQPQCTKESIDRDLAEVHRLGVRDLELVNKFDNGLGGVAGDGGTTGIAINGANFLETGSFWAMQSCDEQDPDVHDRNQITAVPGGTLQDAIFGRGFQRLLPAGTVPVYGGAPHCNRRGLTEMGRHLVRRMAERGMLIDPDHLSVRARRDLLDITEAEGYSGVVSSHSWSTPDAYRRIFRAGGFNAPYAGDSKTFVEQWRKLRTMADPRYLFGIGFGADANGFGAQGYPRKGENPVEYPFRSPVDPAVTLHRQRSGERVYDINEDGVAHYGLYPDWVEDLRRQAGDQIVEDLAQGAEAYLQTWERAVGISPQVCRSPRLRFTRAGLGVLRLGVPAEEQLRGAGQPGARDGRVWSWCIDGREGRGKRVRVAFDRAGRVGLIASTARRHRIAGVGPGHAASRMRGGRRLPGGLRLKDAGGGRRYVFVLRKGRVRATAVASGAAARTIASLREHLRLAGVVE